MVAEAQAVRERVLRDLVGASQEGAPAGREAQRRARAAPRGVRGRAPHASTRPPTSCPPRCPTRGSRPTPPRVAIEEEPEPDARAARRGDPHGRPRRPADRRARRRGRPTDDDDEATSRRARCRARCRSSRCRRPPTPEARRRRARSRRRRSTSASAGAGSAGSGSPSRGSRPASSPRWSRPPRARASAILGEPEPPSPSPRPSRAGARAEAEPDADGRPTAEPDAEAERPTTERRRRPSRRSTTCSPGCGPSGRRPTTRRPTTRRRPRSSRPRSRRSRRRRADAEDEPEPEADAVHRARRAARPDRQGARPPPQASARRRAERGARPPPPGQAEGRRRPAARRRRARRPLGRGRRPRSLADAAAAGATWCGRQAGSVADLADELARSLTAPLRDRIDRSFSAADGNLDDVADRVRALYREWKGQRLTDTSRHYAAAAYARGVFDATARRRRGALGGRPPRRALPRLRRQRARRRRREGHRVPHRPHLRPGPPGVPLPGARGRPLIRAPIASPPCVPPTTCRAVRAARAAATGRGRTWLVVGAVVLFFLITSLRGIASFYTDYLWYDSLGQAGDLAGRARRQDRPVGRSSPWPSS